MSESITHTAIMDDCARLALRWEIIVEPFKQALTERLDAARLGGVTRGGDMFSPDLLDRFRAAWQMPEKRPALLPKLAFVAGWLCHRAADRIMKPVFDAAEPGSPTFPTDCSVYHDAFMFREIYANGKKEPYSPQTLAGSLENHPGAAGLRVTEVEDLFRLYWQRALIGLHTFIPDRADPEGWIERLLKVRQDFIVDISRYAEAYANPDPEKVRRFIVEPNFYDAGDALIRLARAAERDKFPDDADIDAAIAQSAECSRYARALARGLGYLHAASDYMDGRIEQDALRQRLHIGRPGG